MHTTNGTAAPATTRYRPTRAKRPTLTFRDQYSTGQVAKMFQVAQHTIQKWADAGLLPGSYRLPNAGNRQEDRRFPRTALLLLCQRKGIPLPSELSCDVLACVPAPLHTPLARLLPVWSLAHAPDTWTAALACTRAWPRVLLVDLGSFGQADARRAAAHLREAGPRPAVVVLCPADVPPVAAPDWDVALPDHTAAEVLAPRLHSILMGGGA